MAVEYFCLGCGSRRNDRVARVEIAIDDAKAFLSFRLDDVAQALDPALENDGV